MDPLKWLEVLWQYPAGVKWLGVLAVAVMAVFFVALIVVPRRTLETAAESVAADPTPRPNQSAPAVDEAQRGPALENQLDLSLSAYHARLDSLEGRFAERKAFVESLAGKRVRWAGKVTTVNEMNCKCSP